VSPIVRGWVAFAAIGTAVIHLALVVSSPLMVAIPLVAIGVAEAAWAAATLSRDRLVLPRAAIAGALGPLIAWALLLVAATASGDATIASLLPFIPMGIAALFELLIAAVISVRLRRESERSDERSPAPRRTASAPLYLVGMFAGAMLVAGLTTPALAYTGAGQDNPHAAHGTTGTHGTVNLLVPGHRGH
jgi:hypothetical protein